MKKINIIFWSILQVLKLNPMGFIANLLVNLTSAIFPTFLAVETGNIINSLQSDGKNVKELLAKLGVLGVLFLLNSFMYYASAIVTSALNIKTNIKIKGVFIDLVKKIPLKNFDDSEFFNQFANAKEGFNSIVDVTDGIILFVSEIIGLVSAVVALVKIFPLLLLFIIPMYFLGLYLNMRCKKTSFEYWKDTTEKRRMTSYLSGLFFSRKYAKEIKSLDISEFFYSKWRNIREGLREENYLINKKSNKYFAIYQLFMDIMNLLVLLISVFLFVISKILLGQILTAWQLNKNLLMNIQSVNSAYSDIYYNNEKILIAKKMIEQVNNDFQNGVFDTNTENGFAFMVDNVNFSYGNENVLSDINIRISQGEIVAICGDNGSGKSTLVKLLCGLYVPNTGHVRVLGTDTKKIKSSVLSNYLGVIFQDYVCYPYSIRENIGFGSVGNINDTFKIINASKKGEFYEKILRIGDIDKLLGKTLNSNGIELSGGEWQRVALSRAYMDDKPIMIFDEPAAKLDPIAELKQFEMVKKHIHNKTAILISHRIGFARLATRIIVLKNGRVVEDGTHDNLLLKNGEYARLFNEQKQWYFFEEGET